MSDSAILWTVAFQAPPSMGFSRQEYWSGLLQHPPGDLPDPGIKPPPLTSPTLAGSLQRALPGDGTPLQYSCLEKSNGRRSPVGCSPWGRSESGLSDFTFTFHLHALERKMATHSSILAWRIPGTGEAGGLPSMGSHRVGHD